ncbi:MAG: flagellar M-ring protein FliF [Rhodobacteraceae bacterium]|nr:flagellar M-ring protein FliF [Paracoccaceae bacterium]
MSPGAEALTIGRDSLNSVSSSTTGSGFSRRLVAIIASLAVFAAVLGLARGTGSRDLTLLYGGLEVQVAGEVLIALDQLGTNYEVRGGAIYVPETDRDMLRMALAAEGLPANSTQGYELLDNLSGFGTTSQMFDAAYWRAKEGEIARTILSSPHVRAARVHISASNGRPFQRDVRPTAAVTISTAGGELPPGFARALRFLVASAVSGLAPSDVAIIDGEGGLLDAEGDATKSADSRAAALRQRAERLLEARVGLGNVIVEVAVDTVTDTETIIEHVVDPDSRVVISTELEERSTTSEDGGLGTVTVASNLPDGDAAGGGSSSSENSETRSLTNYEISETNREILRVPGAVRRLTVAVLVNDVTVTNEAGETTTEPRSEEELNDLGLLVSSAIGLDLERGDVITIRSMAFVPVAQDGTEAMEIPGAPLDIMSLVQMIVLAAVALVLGLFVVRPILAPTKPPVLANTETPLLAGQIADGAVPALGAPGEEGEDGGGSDPVSRLRRLIEERQDETIQILQSWIEDPDTAGRA